VALDLGWDVVKDVVGWAGAAQKAARTKAERRISNVVEHAGILVAGVSRLNAQVIELVKPLVYFDPGEWDADSRKSLARDLILFANESVVVPRMRASRDALRALVPDLNDRDMAGPATEILEFADQLFGRADQQQQLLSRNPATLERCEPERAAFLRPDGPSLILDSVGNHVYGPDHVLTSALPGLLHYVRTAQDERAANRLRRLAGALTGDVSTSPVMGDWHIDYGRFQGWSVLAPYAADMQAAFGRLIAAQQRAFPNLPPPTWAF
jgi:hypothetical protein